MLHWCAGTDQTYLAGQSRHEAFAAPMSHAWHAHVEMLSPLLIGCREWLQLVKGDPDCQALIK